METGLNLDLIVWSDVVALYSQERMCNNLGCVLATPLQLDEFLCSGFNNHLGLGGSGVFELNSYVVFDELSRVNDRNLAFQSVATVT